MLPEKEESRPASGFPKQHTDGLRIHAGGDELLRHVYGDVPRARPKRDYTRPPEESPPGDESEGDQRCWAAFVLALEVDTFGSIMAGRRVMAGRLDAEMLRRGLRGRRLPHPDAYIDVTVDMLDALVESGPLPERRRRR
jgi:hypothetical protein